MEGREGGRREGSYFLLNWEEVSSGRKEAGKCPIAKNSEWGEEERQREKEDVMSIHNRHG